MSKICIDSNFTDDQKELIPNLPIEGETYTVRKKLLTRNGPAFLLNEITNPPLHDPVFDGVFEPSFSVIRFQNQEEEVGTMSIEEVLDEGLIVA